MRGAISCSEWITLGAAAPAVILGPFMVGGMDWWAQCIINGMQGLLFLIVMLPLTGSVDWKRRVGKLFRFPPFWLGGLFVLYVVIQALNPSWVQIYVEGKGWYIDSLKAEQFVSWLPQSIESNFYTINAWRMVIYWAGAWLFVCGLWAGLNRRRAWLALAWMALATGGVLSLASILHHQSSNEHLFWIELFKRTDGSFGPFVYRNQAAAYLYLNIGLGAALALHLLRTGHGRSGLPWVAIFATCICGLGVAANPSRGGWIGGAAITLIFLLLLPFAIQWRRGVAGGALIGGLAILIGIGASSFWFLRKYDFTEIGEKWGRLAQGDEASLTTRLKVSHLTWDMFEDKPLFGWGAGSFYYRFPRYLLAEPKLYFIGKPGRRMYGKRVRVFKQAHNDHMQFLAEYGVVGYSLMVSTVFWWFGAPIWFRRVTPEWVAASGASMVFLTHNLGDFLMQNAIDLQVWLVVVVFSGGLLHQAWARREA